MAKKESAKLEEASEEVSEALKKSRAKLGRTEKKLTKAEEKVQGLKQANLSLTKGMTDLEKQLGEAKKSEDFTKLEELYGQVEEIKSWRHVVVLPFGEFSFSVRGGYIGVALRNIKPDKTDFLLGASEQAQLMILCDVVNEAREKRIDLEKLQERIRPLADIIRCTSEMIHENDQRAVARIR